MDKSKREIERAQATRETERIHAIRDAHKRFRRGDHVETSELKALLKNIKAAIPFLLSGPEYTLALGQARRDEITIEGYLEARKKAGR